MDVIVECCETMYSPISKSLEVVKWYIKYHQGDYGWS